VIFLPPTKGRSNCQQTELNGADTIDPSKTAFQDPPFPSDFLVHSIVGLPIKNGMAQ